MSSTPVTTDTHIARTFSPSCSPARGLRKGLPLEKLPVAYQHPPESAVSIAAAETHASNGGSHRRMKVRTIAPPAPVREPCVPLQADMLTPGKAAVDKR